APLVVALPKPTSSPAPVTAVSASTLSRVAPYLTARGPPALQARLPPTVQVSALVGSGGQNRPCARKASCSAPLTTPGSTTAQRSSGRIARIRSMRSNDTTTLPLAGTVAPV